jgi:ferredoxin
MPAMSMPEINQSLCVLCGACIESCPTGALSIAGERILLDEGLCSYCGDCEGICPEGAIALPYDIIIRNKPEGGDR